MPALRISISARKLVGAALLSGAALMATACGGTSGIPTSQAAALMAALNQLDQQVANHACDAAQVTSLVQLEQGVAALPNSTGDSVRQTLADSTAYLRTLVAQQCTPPLIVPPPTTRTHSETTRPTTTQPRSTQTTQPPTTTHTAPTQTQPPPTDTGPTTSTQPTEPTVPTQTTPPTITTPKRTQPLVP